ncbi:MAG: hypothetical protein Q7S81_02735 [bacterium]|nr:hypothetical protein [bacterium]
MIKLWWLMWYFTRPNRPKDGNAPNWFNDNISRSYFRIHLAHEKNFYEDWKSTIRRWYQCISGKYPTQATEYGTNLVRIQWKKIDDLIDKAIKKELLIPLDANNRNTTLTTDWRGRDFIKPLYFIEACAREYGYTASVVSSFIIGSGATLFIFFRERFFEFFTK